MNMPPNAVRNVALVVPLLLVNAAAIYGQVMWADEHLDHVGILGAIGFACALESIGIFLAAEAHASLMAGDSSARLRLGSYAVALLVGLLNYAHFAPTLDHPTPQALAFGAMSVISPWLWSIRSRSMSRAQLRAEGLIDGRAVKFTAAQWALYPRSSFRAFRRAVWVGETNPDRARSLISPAPDPAYRRHVHEWPAPIGPQQAPAPPADGPVALPAWAFIDGQAVEEQDPEMLARILAGIPDGVDQVAQLVDGDRRHTGYPAPIGPVPAVEPKPVKPKSRAKAKGMSSRRRSDPSGKDRAWQAWQSNPALTGDQLAEIAKTSRTTAYRWISQWSQTNQGVSA